MSLLKRNIQFGKGLLFGLMTGATTGIYSGFFYGEKLANERILNVRTITFNGTLNGKSTTEAIFRSEGRWEGISALGPVGMIAGAIVGACVGLAFKEKPITIAPRSFAAESH